MTPNEPAEADRPLGVDAARGRHAALFGALFLAWLIFLVVLAVLGRYS